MRIASAQLNAFVGDLAGNTRKILLAMERAAHTGADILVTPELAVTGYPPEDLLHRAHFVEENLRCVAAIARASRKHPGLLSVVGGVDRRGGALFNAAFLVRNGRIAGRYHKQLLPNYGVFDERRYFKPGTGSPVFRVAGRKIAVTICEDLWVAGGAPERQVARARPDLAINLSASPYEAGKGTVRERTFARVARLARSPLVLVNQVGGQDELVFDGRSASFDAAGKVRSRCASFEEDFSLTDTLAGGVVKEPPGEMEEIYRALVLGVRDYAGKNGFKGVVIGLSGGIDSSITAMIAADAVGPSNVAGVAMSSRYTARASEQDARLMANRLGIKFLEMPIGKLFTGYLESLGPHVAGREGQLARENLQARIRGALLMALSNRYGWLLIATGNKSEMSVGYATLYGDMAGGFAVLKDVPKTLVYPLARWRNSRDARPAIPERVFTRPPTAELRPNQKDSDSLPPYPVLDGIIQSYVEEDRSPGSISGRGFSRATVDRVVKLIEKSEYKRRQAPPGVKIRPRAFGRDRRMPITHGYGGKRV
jgi:NAD+ synthase (glutamine-hydrolysing)